MKSFGISFFSIPTPVSITLNLRKVLSWFINLLTLIVMLPLSVNLSEFDTKLIKTCFRRFASELYISWEMSLSQIILKSSLFSAHWNPKIYSMSLSTDSSKNGSMLSLNVFELNLAMSNISSTRFNSNQDETSPILKVFFDSWFQSMIWVTDFWIVSKWFH